MLARIIRFLYNRSVFALADIRAALWRLVCPRVGRGTQFLGGVIIYCPEGVCIGERTAINVNCRLDGNGGLVIGNDCMFGPNVQIITANHCFNRLDIPMKYQGISGKKVIIMDDVWLGANVIILPGVTIGKGAVIGAGSVVTHDVAPFNIVAGVPACFIGKRSATNSIDS